MISKKIFVSVVYFKKSEVIRTAYLNPVQAGAAVAGRERLDGILGDDSGDNISVKNAAWNELTAIYWMRHNVDAEYYGTMHYRRLLCFSAKAPHHLPFCAVGESEYERFGWDDALIEKACSENDILIPQRRPVLLFGMPELELTPLEFYAHQHQIADMALIEEIVREQSPHIYPYFVRVLTGRRVFFNNITVMRKALFIEYADWLTAVIEAAEKRRDLGDYDAYQGRIWGFLAEYLTNAYVLYAEAVHDAKVKELPLAWGTRPVPEISPEQALARARGLRRVQEQLPAAQGGEDIHVAFTITKGYVAHLATSILSCLQTTANPARLNIFVVNDGSIGASDRDRLMALAGRYAARLSFVDFDDRSLRWLPQERPNSVTAVYYRLALHRLLPDTVDRVIYLDADLLLIEPLEHLWETDLEGCGIAAAPESAGLLHSRRLRMPYGSRYFSAGVLLIDLATMRRMDFDQAVLTIMREKGSDMVSHVDDILNLLFCGNVKMLHLRWNAVTKLYEENALEPSYDEAEGNLAAKEPSIIHFSGKAKPWKRKCVHPLSELYWDYRNQTPWAESWREQHIRQLFRYLRLKHRDRKRRLGYKLSSGG
ncbi:DUF4422 domain-containing protein [Martelella alba]|uniref:DUF4422 domain-containing protein n=1 Tax=Martelella alba TaxID=2590451 RepID=A0A506U3J5_9HYPH|nr:DUF4422 domain-containing protein [Martelella alba]TPW27861.1 DUF4422 domain-containing protein [Martelella alba]